VFPARRPYTVPLPDGRVLDLGSRPLVMGILNVTPDSFAEPSPRTDPVAAADDAVRMEAEGADIVDVGGESTRPGADPLPAAEEARRVLPVIRMLRGRLRIPISIDTYKAEIAEAAIAEGATIVNDVSGLRYEPALAAVVARTGAALVVMHTRGRSKTMYQEARYEDVVQDVTRELDESLQAAVRAGIARDRLIVDAGIGFAKRAADSYGVLARLPELVAGLDRPVLAGPSRKSFMQDALGRRPPTARDWGTAAAVTAAVLSGAHILRVHAVAEMVQVVRVAEEIRRHGGR
jgi:dihydropteroate synthase